MTATASSGDPRGPDQVGVCQGRERPQLLFGPAVEEGDRAPLSEGEGQLAQRSPAASDADDRVTDADDQAVAKLAEPGRQRDRQVRVAVLASITGQETDGFPTFAPDALADCLHHAAEPAADDHRIPPPQQGADLASAPLVLGGRIVCSGSDHRHVVAPVPGVTGLVAQLVRSGRHLSGRRPPRGPASTCRRSRGRSCGRPSPSMPRSRAAWPRSRIVRSGR